MESKNTWNIYNASQLKEAERFAEEDKKKKEEIETRNTAEQLIYTTEKSMEDLKDKLDDADKTVINEKLEVLKNIKDSNDMEAIKKATEDLTEAFYKASEKIYQEEAKQAGAENPEGPKDDNVVDADFKVEDDK